MPDHAVLIAGAGPTGLMLAAELALAGIDVALIERRTTPERIAPGALGLYSRTLEILDQRGVSERFSSQGTKHPAVHFHIPLNISDLPTRHNYTLGLKQKHTERILAEWVEELRVPILRGREVTGFVQHDTGVDVTLADGQTLRAEYLVGCDGGRSVIRKTAGMEFPGWDATMSWLIVEAETTEEPKWGFHHDAAGIHAIGKGERTGVSMVLTEATLGTGDPTLQDVRDALIAIRLEAFCTRSRENRRERFSTDGCPNMLEVLFQGNRLSACLLHVRIARKDFQCWAKTSEYGISTDYAFVRQSWHPFVDASW